MQSERVVLVKPVKPKYVSIVLDSVHMVVAIPEYYTLKIFEDDGVEDGVYLPAQSIKISGRQKIEELRDFLNEHFPKGESANGL